MNLIVSRIFLAFSPIALVGGHLSLLLFHQLQDFHRGQGLTCFTFRCAKDENSIYQENLPHKHSAYGQLSSLWWPLWGSRSTTITTGLLMDTHCPQLVKTEAFPTICHIPPIDLLFLWHKNCALKQIENFYQIFYRSAILFEMAFFIFFREQQVAEFWKHQLPGYLIRGQKNSIKISQADLSGV